MVKAGPRKELMERELLDHAAELFARNGFSGTSLQEIADTANVGRTSLYHYFSSKEAFLTALVEDVTMTAWTLLSEIRQRSDLSPRRQLEAAARMLVMRVLSKPARFRVLERDEASLPEELAELHRKGKRDSLAELAAIIDAGVVAGEFRPVDSQIAALTIFGMCNWPAWWFNPKGQRNASSVADAVSTMAVGSILRDDVAGPSTPAEVIRGIRDDLATLARMVGLRET
ncbi:TetR/AcrR family transcriptional regulator [Bradyrhizobium barranii subsp. apii]|uniref:TetR/AcrR family transcriptional regulator n=1 Tax=Bradyrhizobium barranii subsp. apii TaxID=2819348 RepID=A0A8T5VT85_9BRAD|nr:TetR/AcrR family transcriptional regulator [Bradyrhizobium barranii]UPT89192.1 TetR/AcrR family transcriptional regulator [Bradyrhizobium barranii subsp. apii]UPT95050.1 TetR/AcrR family transcriptional regulator [Bradyrhizobium barranii subsp. apii]